MVKTSTFPNLEGLVDLACRSGVDIRPTLLRVLTDLYVQKRAHSIEEEAQYVELAQRLIETVDAPTRATVAARLAAYPSAPAAIFDRLADLIGYIPSPPIQSGKDPAEPAENELIELFFMADADERRLILINLDVDGTGALRGNPPAAVESCRRLENAALERNTGEFVNILEQSLAIDGALARRMVEDALGEPLVVTAKVLGMQPAVLQRILLFINPVIGQSVRRVYELANLYDEISVQAAESMIDSWRGNAGKRRPAHQPVHYDDERRGARAAATSSRYRSARRNDALTARFKSAGR